MIIIQKGAASGGALVEGTADYQTLAWDETEQEWIANSILNVDFDTNRVGIGTDSLDTKLHIVDATGPQQKWEFSTGIDSTWTTGADGVTTLATSGNSFVFPDGTVSDPGIVIDVHGFFKSSLSNTLGYAVNGGEKWRFSGSAINGQIFNSAGILNEGASATNPTLVPNRGDRSSGMGAFAIGKPSIIAGGVEGIRITTTETQFKAGLHVNKTRITEATYTVVDTDQTIFANTDSNAITISLQAGVDNRNLRIVNTGSSSNNLTITPNGTENLLGDNSSFTLADGESLIISYDENDGWF